MPARPVRHGVLAARSRRSAGGHPRACGQVSKAGIKKVAGHVLVDVSLFPEGERELGTGVVMTPFAVNDMVDRRGRLYAQIEF
jgi:hypothetical protein